MSTTSTNAEQERAHILVVEDDRDIRESIVDILEDQGYGVSAASDGFQALQRLSQGEPRPDLILLDLMMPNMNGFEFREEQLKRAEHSSIPVAVFSADGNVMEKSERIRADAWVRKPLKIESLLAVVERLLQRASA